MRATGFWVVLMASAAFGLVKPNFSGTWVMDKARSFNNPAGLEQTMIVKHEGDTISIDATLVMAQGERKITETWKLNNVAEEFTPPAQPNSPADAKGKRTAYWLAGDRGAILNEEIASGGKTLSQTQRKWTLLPDGTTLIVDYFIDGPRGSYEAKRVFLKKE